MDRQRNARTRGLAAVLLLALCSACPDEQEPAPEPGSGTPAPVEPAPVEPDEPDEPTPQPEPQPETEWEELSALWRKAAEDPASLGEEEKILLESFFVPLAPPVEGAEWQVITVLGKGPAELRANLMRDGRQLVALDMQYRLDVAGGAEVQYGSTKVEGYLAAVRKQFVFVLVGNVELRMEGTAPDWRTTEKVQGLLTSFPLERIAEL